jgi:hypothetical protein
MIKVTMTPTINIKDVEKQLNVHMNDFEFTKMADNDSYVALCLNDYATEELEDSIAWEEGKNTRRQQRLRNQLTLVHLLRDMGFNDYVLVYIFW